MEQVVHQQIIDQTVAFVKQELEGAEGGHDWWHIYRVWQSARHIAAGEAVDMLVVELGALLHDIADAKFHNGDEEIGPAKAGAFLQQLAVPVSVIDHVVLIIRHISFKGGNNERIFHSPELGVVQDADRLDAIGAIGIARAFNYGGFKQRALHDPAIPPNLQMTREEYKKNTAPTINHFYEKLLLLKDRMNTASGRAMAEERHQFMEQFLTRFYQEWEGQL
ncbi:HD domain-containing protein [Chitinophaga pendula]|uniref:HD domain-containing protein n=1 Tax=Chitinophaga TaxID=79328 RepID=UPI000BAF7CF1|nr:MULTISPECIES: HD domain-containing protein [Chitinophaga]ASZ14451.1 phosphohydrolase [Chitinophaga sp. MD30]UCJ07893.1 HD domain-containing protein [Chitinophaga pendula]